MWSYNYSDELYHFGVKGMKWGVIRKKDDTSEPKPKSKHRQKLENKYISQGYTANDAAALANRRIKAEKFVIGVAAVTAVAATAYVANKHIKYKVDGYIKEGSKLNRVAKRNKVDLDSALYTSKNKLDNIKYRGMLGDQKLHYNNADKVHNITLKATGKIKVASRKHAEDTFLDLYKNDKKFKADVLKSLGDMFMGTTGQLSKDIETVLKDPNNVSEKLMRNNIYDLFNIGLVDNTPHAKSSAKTFYDTLKSKGYDAIKDINDQKYSGYKAKTPYIVFNAKNKLAVDKVKELSRQQINKDYRNAKMIITGQDFVEETFKVSKESTLLSLYTGGVVGVNHAVSTKYIKEYRKQHPNSNLTDREIIALYNEQRSKKK